MDDKTVRDGFGAYAASIPLTMEQMTCGEFAAFQAGASWQRAKAQPADALVEALEASTLLLRTKRHACGSAEVCHVLDVHIKRNIAAIAAHKAQVGHLAHSAN
jgi:hypothetical protein